MSHRITLVALNCAPSSSPSSSSSDLAVKVLSTMSHCHIVPEVRTTVQYLFPSHRLAKRNACGTKRYGVVACQPVPTACRSSNA